MTCYNSELPIGPPGPVGPQGPQGPPVSGNGVSLAETLLIGDQTNGTNILIGNDAVVVVNGSKLEKGSIDNNTGGGISLICTNEKEQQWENGVRYLRQIGSANVYAETLDNINPSGFYDDTRNWGINSKYKNLVTGIEYICTDASTNAAIWIPSIGSWEPDFNIQSGSFVVAAIGGSASYSKTDAFVQFFFKLRIAFATDNIANFRMSLPFTTVLGFYDSIAICSLMNAKAIGGAVIKNTNNGNSNEIEFQFETENLSDDYYEFNVIGNFLII